jgi:hypothetical protein
MENGDTLMNKPNFEKMTRKELKTYFLAHRDDDEAFYAYVDKLHAEANWIKMPALNSVEEMKNYPQFIEKLRQN